MDVSLNGKNVISLFCFSYKIIVKIVYWAEKTEKEHFQSWEL